MFLLLCTTLSCLLRLVNSAPSHQFSFGRVEGYDVTSPTSSLPVYVYYGIPFAEPPVGELRFEPPQPYRGRGQGNVISSTGFREACMQPGVYSVNHEVVINIDVLGSGCPTHLDFFFSKTPNLVKMCLCL